MRLTNDRGRESNVVLPAHLDVLAPPVAVEAEKLGRLELQLAATMDEDKRLARDLEVAEHERGEKIADAILEGRPMPTKDATESIRKAIDVARSRMEGIRTAIARQERTVLEVLEESRDELVAAAIERRSVAAEGLRSAIEAMAVARDSFMRAEEDVTWLRDFPVRKTSWAANPGSLLLEAPVPNGLVLWPEVVDALVKDATPERRNVPERMPGMPVPRRVREGLGYGKPLSQMTVDERMANDAYERGETDVVSGPGRKLSPSNRGN